MQAANCVNCGAPGPIKSGHLHQSVVTVTAAWCAECRDLADYQIPRAAERRTTKRGLPCPGCYGPWLTRDGIQGRLKGEGS